MGRSTDTDSGCLPSMDILVCGDLHLKPGGEAHSIEKIPVAEEIDFALVVGDLTHRDGPEDIALAREFVEYVTDSVPLLYVPGNHDHMPMPEQVVDGIEDAAVAHETTFETGALSVVGLGCTQRSLETPLDVRDFEPLDPTTIPPEERRYAADTAAEQLLEACRAVIIENQPVPTVATELGLTREEQAQFEAGVETVSATYEKLDGLLTDTEHVMLATHLSPYNSSFDRHHSVGGRNADLEALHTGSIAIRLAIKSHDVFASVSGHSHSQGYDVGPGVAGQSHLVNLGFRGVAEFTLRSEDGAFSYTTVDISL